MLLVTEYKLGRDLVLSSGKGASLQGKINVDGHNVTFGEGTHFFLEVAGESGVSGYIRDAGTLTIGTGPQFHIDVLDDTWTTENVYTVFSAGEDIQGTNNLELTLNEEYAFVDVSLDLSNSRELGCAIPLSQTFSDVQVKDGWGNNDNDTYNVDVFARYRKGALTITGVLTGWIAPISA